eukprot:CAMPEP_0172493756 /NCGR_PEP_ID=MMETSP1066-20121228/28260_1 /TAXON_ID=671091 /ORGANISM="Coscinodiscus wailesii, Strain CCMP2513" /LENGTH=44 /DNA_ID= /DNA_START= /DNA_END= /DNA_ORIENTATION=
MKSKVGLCGNDVAARRENDMGSRRAAPNLSSNDQDINQAQEDGF